MDTMERAKQAAIELDALEKRIMDGADERWHISARSPAGFDLCVDTAVEHPGYEGFWVLIWVNTERASIEILSTAEGKPPMLEDQYEMTPDQLIEYLHTLPRPLTAFGAKAITD